MDIFCACPFAVATLGWDPGPGRRSLSVCVKATLVLVPGGTCAVAAVQDPVRVDEAAGTAAPDLVPFKPRVDVLFAGHAHAPGGAPTDSLIARARVGAFRKSLSINGDRTWVPSFDGLRPSVAVPFRRMPLTYERAVRTGENLTGVDISQGAEPNRPLANIAAIADQGGETPGLGPIPFAWRALRLGLAEGGLLWASRAGLLPGPPPPGFDFRIFNAAPAEQQLEELPPGAEVLLENLHPEQPRLETRLPSLRVKVFRRPLQSPASVEVPVRCDTLWIDTDRGLALLLWRAAVLLEGDDEAETGRLVITAEVDAERIGVADVDRMLARLLPDVTYVDPGHLRQEVPRVEDPGDFPPIGDPIPIPDAVSLPVPPRASESFPAPASLRSEPPVTPLAPPALPLAAPGPALPVAPPSAPSLPPGIGEEEPLDAPTPAPEERRAPITLVPPPEEVSTVHALPFRPPPTGFDPVTAAPPPAEGAEAAAWDVVDEDTEMTPPRGYPAVADLRAALAVGSMGPVSSVGGAPAAPLPVAAPAPLATAALPPPEDPVTERVSEGYAAVKMEVWRRGEPLGVVLARRGIDEAAFHAHEAAQREALGREAAEGGSERAVALIEELSAAARR